MSAFDKKMPHQILFSLFDEIQNTKKDKHTRIKRKINRVSRFNIFIVVFAYLSSTVEEGRW